MGNHGDTMPNMKAVKLKAQGGGSKPLAHVITAALSVIVSLVLAHYLATGPAGAQGPSGPAGGTVVRTNVDAGVCAYFGPDSAGVTRMQLSEPLSDPNGPYCAKGKLILVTPKR